MRDCRPPHRLVRALRLLALLPLLATAAMQTGETGDAAAPAAVADAAGPADAADAAEAAIEEEIPDAPKASVHYARIETPGAEARLSLEMEEPGVVRASFGADMADAGLETEIFNPLGESLGKGAAFNFIPGTVEIAVRDPKGQFARPEPVVVVLEVRPEADFLEPNSEANPAVIALNAWYDNVLMPLDTDHFLIDVPEAGVLYVEHADRSERFEMALRPLAEGAAWSGQVPYEAPEAGRYLLRLTDRSAKPEVTPFRFRVVWTPPATDVVRDLPLGTAVPAWIAKPGAVERFLVKLPEDGMLSVQAMGTPPERTLIQLKQGEWQVTEAQVRRAVKAGSYEVAVYTQYKAVSPRPFYVLANLYKTVDAAEPNNDRDTATPAALDKPLHVSLFPKTDEDWFRFDIPEAGYLTLHLETGPEHGNRALNSVRFWARPQEGENDPNAAEPDPNAIEQVTVPRHVSRRGIRVGPFKVAPGPLYMSSSDPHREAPRMDFVATPDFRSGDAAGRGDQVFVIGLGLNDNVKAQMAAMTDATGGVYVDAESTEVLKARVEEVKRRAEKEARRRLGTGGGGWIWVLLILAAAGGAGYYYRDPLRETARTYGWLLRPVLSKLPGMPGRGEG